MPIDIAALLQFPIVFIAQDPFLRAVQGTLLLLGALDVFLIFWTTRDVLLRSQSFLVQAFCILLVATLPYLGFLLYLLIRPARTVKEREVEKLIQEILAKHQKKIVKKESKVGKVEKK